MSSFLVKAPAKINLFLHVVSQDEEGYHELESLFAFIDLFDIIEIRTNAKISGVSFVGSSFRINRYYNTVQKAIELLHTNAGVDNATIFVKVIKKIFVGAGLAGGSADAAALLRVLGNHWNIDRKIIEDIALKIGMDVFACLDSKMSLIQNKGDKLIVVNALLPKNLVLVNPRKSLSTGRVFQNYCGSFSDRVVEIPKNSESWLELVKKSNNDLFNTAVNFVPEIGAIIDALSEQEDCILARMSGSGPTCFALFPDKQSADKASSRIQQKYPQWWSKNLLIL